MSGQLDAELNHASGLKTLLYDDLTWKDGFDKTMSLPQPFSEMGSLRKRELIELLKEGVSFYQSIIHKLEG